MIRLRLILIAAGMLTGCAATAREDSAFQEWRDYELATPRPPPASYRLDGNEEYCRPWPLSECTYRNGDFALSYQDGLLISKEAIVRGTMIDDPLLGALASAGDENHVIAILKEQGKGYPPDCFDNGGSHYCGVVVSTDPSTFFQVRFSTQWELLSISFNVPDAL